MKYVYFLKHIPTGLMYIGSRYTDAASPDEFWHTYFTSSKRVKSLIEQYGPETFEYSIRKTFESREACFDYECRLLSRLQARYRKDFLNLHHNEGFSCSIPSRRGKRNKPPKIKYFWYTDGTQDIKCSEGTDPKAGFYRGRTRGKNFGKRSPQFCAKMSAVKKGVPLSEHHLKRIKETRVGMTGKKHTSETKQKMRESRLLVCQRKKSQSLNEMEPSSR